MIPVSIVDGKNPKSRRLLRDIDAANGDPDTATKGASTKSCRYLTFVVEVAGTPGVVTYRVWYWIRTAGQWVIDVRPAPDTAGVVTFDATTEANPQLNIAEILGWERVYVEVLSVDSGATVNVWVEGLSPS